jgi:hypothetical protein
MCGTVEALNVAHNHSVFLCRKQKIYVKTQGVT